ncbi:MFS transporter small subunit [Streptomyces sulphureus]|nr:hypothetical protein [Streptomyces sulphureus]
MAPSSASPEPTAPRRTWLAVLVWLWVGLPFAYGIYELALKVAQLFTD